MQIRQLEYFIAVSEHLNFTRAAEQFYISQTAVTQAIKALEDEIGARLFDRTNRRVSLTPAGRTFLEDARAIVRRCRDSINRAKSADTEVTGRLRLGFVKGFEKTVLSDLLSDFHGQYPNISITLMRENVSELYDAVLDRSVDVVLNLQYSPFLPKEICKKIVRHYPLVAIMPAAHPLAHRSCLRRSELKGYPLVDIKQSLSKYDEAATITAAFASAGFLPEISYVSDDIETSILAVAAGLGYALLPTYITDALPHKEKVIAVPLEGEEDRMTVVCAWHRENKNSVLDVFTEKCLFPAIQKRLFGGSD